MRSPDTTNRHGLSRADFKAPKRRELRQACGFGCVMCGDALYEYAHVDPPFEDAKAHDIEQMALLCSSHHAALDRFKRISKADVMAARRSPRARQAGFASDSLHPTTDEFILTIGEVFFCDCQRILNIEGTDVLRIDLPEAPGAPYRVTGLFCDAQGALVASIAENEVTVFDATWDVEVSGPKMTFRAGPGRICLVLITIPGSGLRIERMDMSWAGVRVEANDDGVVVSGGSNSSLSMRSYMFQSCEVCIGVKGEQVSLGSLP